MITNQAQEIEIYGFYVSYTGWDIVRTKKIFILLRKMMIIRVVVLYLSLGIIEQKRLCCRNLKVFVLISDHRELICCVFDQYFLKIPFRDKTAINFLKLNFIFQAWKHTNTRKEFNFSKSAIQLTLCGKTRKALEKNYVKTTIIRGI